MGLSTSYGEGAVGRVMPPGAGEPTGAVGPPGVGEPEGVGACPDATDKGAPAATVRLLVPDALRGERVDRALALLAGVSRAEASRMVADGRVRVGRSTVNAGGRRLRAGEWLEVDPHLPIRTEPVTGEPGAIEPEPLQEGRAPPRGRPRPESFSPTVNWLSWTSPPASWSTPAQATGKEPWYSSCCSCSPTFLQQARPGTGPGLSTAWTRAPRACSLSPALRRPAWSSLLSCRRAR